MISSANGSNYPLWLDWCLHTRLMSRCYSPGTDHLIDSLILMLGRSPTQPSLSFSLRSSLAIWNGLPAILPYIPVSTSNQASNSAWEDLQSLFFPLYPLSNWVIYLDYSIVHKWVIHYHYHPSTVFYGLLNITFWSIKIDYWKHKSWLFYTST